MITMMRQGFPCLFHLITGLYCPGCGGTRAARALVYGHPLRSLYYHPLVPYAAVVCLVLAVSWCVARLLKRPRLQVHFRMGMLYTGLAVMAVNWIARNVLLIACGIPTL